MERKKKQEILEMTTNAQDLRSKASEWICESGRAVVDAARKYECNIDDVVTGHIQKSVHSNHPKTPLHALGFGWRLMAPPTRRGLSSQWEWYFEMMVEEDTDWE